MFDCPGAHLNQTTRNSLLRGGTGQHEPLKTDTETCAASRARVMTTVTHKKHRDTAPNRQNATRTSRKNSSSCMTKDQSRHPHRTVTAGPKRLVIRRRKVQSGVKYSDIGRAFSRRFSTSFRALEMHSKQFRPPMTGGATRNKKLRVTIYQSM